MKQGLITIVTMEVCFDNPKLDFDENWNLRELQDTEIEMDEVFIKSVDVFREGLKKHMIGGGSYVITKINDYANYHDAEQEHCRKLLKLCSKSDLS